MISLDDVEHARHEIAHVLRPTPVRHAESISTLCGRPVLIKPEYLQRTGSFKVRGAMNFISQLPPGIDVVAASAGNHAQGVALAAALTGRKATIFMPSNASLPKVDATRAYGATVCFEGTVVDECMRAAKAFAAEHPAVFVPPFDDPHVIAGQGTVGLEIIDEEPDADVVVVPVGGGGLIAGVATAVTALRPSATVIGVEAAGAASMVASLAAGRPVALDAVSTMADGIALKSPSALTLEHVQARVADVVTVTEEEISAALLLLLERAKAVVEPSGAVALAALLAGRVPGAGPAVAVLSGGNVDPLLLIKLIEHGLSAAGRYLVLRIVLRDRPGALALLTEALAALNLNVLEVEHHRAGLDLGLDEVEVMLTLETRDPEHRNETVTALQDAGFRVELVR